MKKESVRELLYGKREYVESKYKKLYGERDYKEKVEEQNKKLRLSYGVVILAFILLMAWTTIENMAGNSAIMTGAKGNIVSVKRPAENSSSMVMRARVYAISGTGAVSSSENIVIEAKNSYEGSDNQEEVIGRESEEDELKRKIATTVNGLNQDTSKGKIVLPTELEDGTKLVWQEERESNYGIIIAVFVLLLFIVYKNRLAPVRREEAAARASIVRNLPEFINKTVLLLNAGILINGAFEKIMQDYERNQREEREENYFYEQLHMIYLRCREANSPMHKELQEFAKRSGVRELMRVSNIIGDNINKGSDLSVKLRREGETLWFARKKLAEEKGKLAETKLTMPLVILLLVLVMITIAPAMLEI